MPSPLFQWPASGDDTNVILRKLLNAFLGVVTGQAGLLVRGSIGSSVSASDTGLSSFRTTNAVPLTNVAQAVKASAGNLYGLVAINPNTAPIFLKFFNVAAAGVTPGTTVPARVYEIPAADGVNNGQLLITPDAMPLKYFSTAISVLATSVLADTGAQTAPTTTLKLVDVDYK